MVAQQRSRGPDFSAVETISDHARGGGVILGHNRLAIIDLSSLGNQPMWDHTRGLCIVFNGEIYNYVELRHELAIRGHRFLSTSDTEVILEAIKAWGADAFSRFNGMFALAVYDVAARTLLLARDRFGVKPLYFVCGRDKLHFASTSATMAHCAGLEPDLNYVARGIRYSLYDGDEHSPYQGMKAVRPGHVVKFHIDSVGRLASSETCFYDLQVRVAEQVEVLATRNDCGLVEDLSVLLEDAVRIRLRADVPVAVSLSGGLDSSTVAALAARQPQTEFRGFTFGDPAVADSEGPLAAALGEQAGVRVSYIWPDLQTICDAFDRTLAAQGAPFPGASVIAQHLVFQTARAEGFKVLLGGQGGDEAFMGYRKFQAFHLSRLLARRDYRHALTFALSLFPMFIAERRRWIDSWQARNRYLKKSGMASVLQLPGTLMALGDDAGQSLRYRQMADVTTASLPTLLRYEDGNSMGNSIESRLPFLDYRVMEFGLALSEALKLRGGHGKWILREVAAGKIPEQIRVARYKRGFDVQEARWIEQGLGDCIRSRLQAVSGRIAQWLRPGVRLMAAFTNEHFRSRPTTFAAATTLLWLAQVSNRATGVEQISASENR